MARGKNQRDRDAGLSGNASLHRGWMLPIRVPMVSRLPGRTLTPAALDTQREPHSGEGPGRTPLPLRAGERAHDAFRHRHGARPRRAAEKLRGGRWGLAGSRELGGGEDRAASHHRGPRPRCSTHGILRRGPLFGRAGLRGRIPLSELGNILF